MSELLHNNKFGAESSSTTWSAVHNGVCARAAGNNLSFGITVCSREEETSGLVHGEGEDGARMVRASCSESNEKATFATRKIVNGVAQMGM